MRNEWGWSLHRKLQLVMHGVLVLENPGCHNGSSQATPSLIFPIQAALRGYSHK